jgi:F0F1-type ATP synthase gamma subunit
VEKTVPVRPTDYVSPRHLAEIAVREFLYITLYELLLDALASEHGMRLVATEAAGEWLQGRIAATERQLFAVKREEGTQEVLDVASGARRRSHPS